MTLKYFFWHNSDLAELNQETGFDLYSMGHLIWLVAIAAATWYFSGIYKKQDSIHRKQIKRFFAIFLLAIEVLKDIYLCLTGNFSAEYLPFHLCSIAIFVILIDAFIEKQQISRQLIAYAFMPGAVSALLFCNWTEYPFLNYMNIHSFIFHGWIVCYMVMIYRGKELGPIYKGIWQTALFIGVTAPPLFLFNSIFGTNFMFLNVASEGSPLVPLWNLFGEEYGYPGYLTAYAILAVAVFHVLWLFYFLMEKGLAKGEKDEKKTRNMFVA